MILMYFVICFGLFMVALIDRDGYLYFFHPSKYLEECDKAMLLVMSVTFFFIELGAVYEVLTSRMKEIEYEYQPEKTEKRKHNISQALISKFLLSLFVCGYLIAESAARIELPKIIAVGMLFVTGWDILSASKYRMKIFEYEYKAGKIEERKYRRKKRQRVSSIIFVILFSLLPLAGQLIHMSENGSFYQGCYFACVEKDSRNQDIANEKVCYITDVDALPFVTKIEIPETINGYRVIGMRGELFKYYKALKNVTIPEGVRFIGEGVFSNCNSALYTEYEYGKYVGDSTNPYAVLVESNGDNMGTYEIHADTKIIANGVFQECDSLTNITIPDSVTSIGDEAFFNCRNLTSVTIPDSVTTIGGGAFKYCSKLTSVTIPDSVTTIGSEAFYGCSNLTSVYIYDIAAWCNIVFKNYVGNPLNYAKNLYLIKNGTPELITDLVIPNTVTTIDNYAFYGCDGLTSITIPDSVTTIGGGAFKYCSKLTSVTIPDSVTTIGDAAFYSCDSLTSITIPDSVTSIGYQAFYECYNLTSVTFANPNGWWCTSDVNGTGSTVISASDLSNTSTAAKYLRSFYSAYWFRTEEE